MFELSILPKDGPAWTPSEAARARVTRAPEVSLPSAKWQQVTNPIVLAHGALRLSGLALSNAPSRFFRVIQLP